MDEMVGRGIGRQPAQEKQETKLYNRPCSQQEPTAQTFLNLNSHRDPCSIEPYATEKARRTQPVGHLMPASEQLTRSMTICHQVIAGSGRFCGSPLLHPL